MPDEKYLYRPAPCPACDAECMESWLEDLAADGLLLTRDGFLAGFGIFRRGEPQRCRYRLVPTAKAASVLDDTDAPDEDEQHRRQAYGWEYVARRGSFHIYRSPSDAPDLPTDRETRETALTALRKQSRGSLWNCAFLSVPVSLALEGVLLRTVLNFGFWPSLLAFALLLSFVLSACGRLACFSRLRRQLMEGDTRRQKADWRRRALRHHTFLFTQIAAVMVLTAALAHLMNTVDSTYAPVSVCTGRPAFATIAELGGEGSRTEPFGSGLYSNKFRAWSDPLSPICMEWRESADLYLPDGTKVFVTLRADYYDTVHPLLALLLAREHRWEDRFLNREFASIPIPSAEELGVDYAAAHADRTSLFPTVVLQKGTRVYHACFSGGNQLDMAETVRRMADALS